VAITDNHVAHILEHSVIYDTPQARMNPNSPEYVAAKAHNQKHQNKLLGGIDPVTGIPEGPINPVLAGILGYPTIPLGTPSPMQLPPMGPPPPPPGQEPPAQGPVPRGKQPQSPAGQASQPTQTLPENPTGGMQPPGMVQ
jgi:hypothetical protein